MRGFTRCIVGVVMATAVSWGNDGAYTMSGNHIMPTTELDISIKKEVLTIKRLKDNTLDVVVDYTLYNPKAQKSITVGFEASSPSGASDGRPLKGEHPYMKQFVVELNGVKLPYKVATVTTKDYIKDGKIVSDDVTAVIKKGAEWDWQDLDIGFVYYFDATFKEGENHLIHHYRYEHTVTVMTNYEFDYILTTASRWKGSQIDDFTLIIDMGEYQEFMINRDFFSSANEWLHDGTVRDIRYRYSDGTQVDMAKFYTVHNPVVFHKRDFKIKGDLRLGSYLQAMMFDNTEHMFDYKKHDLPYSSESVRQLSTTVGDPLSYKIIRNHPYAKRGYVFKTPAIQRYYDKMAWYSRDLSYKPNRDDLSPKDRAWLKSLKR